MSNASDEAAGVPDHLTPICAIGTSAGGINALQQFSFAFGVAVFGTVFFDIADGRHLASDALGITALATLVPLVIAFGLAFRLPPRAREGAAAH